MDLACSRNLLKRAAPGSLPSAPLRYGLSGVNWRSELPGAAQGSDFLVRWELPRVVDHIDSGTGERRLWRKALARIFQQGACNPAGQREFVKRIKGRLGHRGASPPVGTLCEPDDTDGGLAHQACARRSRLRHRSESLECSGRDARAYARKYRTSEILLSTNALGTAQRELRRMRLPRSAFCRSLWVTCTAINSRIAMNTNT